MLNPLALNALLRGGAVPSPLVLNALLIFLPELIDSLRDVLLLKKAVSPGQRVKLNKIRNLLHDALVATGEALEPRRSKKVERKKACPVDHDTEWRTHVESPVEPS